MLYTRPQQPPTMGMGNPTAGREHQRHLKSMSHSDVRAHQHTVQAVAGTNRHNYDAARNHHPGYAFGQQQQQTLETPYQHSRPYVPLPAAGHGYHNHGKKPSLAGFDPFSSSAGSPVIPNGRDTSPTLGGAFGGRGSSADDQARQSVTPPAAGRPLVVAAAATSSLDATEGSTMTNFERFTNEKTGKNPVAKQVNKFLRKAVLATNRSFGVVVQQHSSSPGGGNKVNNKKLSPVAAIRPTTATPAGGPEAPSLSPRESTGGASKQVNKFLRKAAMVRRQSTPGQPSPTSKGGKNTKTATTDGPSPLSPVATRPLTTATPQAPAGAQKEQQLSMADPSRETTTTSMAQDLMELRDQFGHLRIPSLSANIAPTSFLTGTGEEAVTTSNEPTPFQLEIPSLEEAVTTARLNEFVEDYRQHDQNLDLSTFVGRTRMQLQRAIDASASIHHHDQGTVLIREHVPIVQSLLDCAQNGGEISVQGFLQEAGDLPADSRAEAVVFQGQRNFTVVFRGTTEQQSRVLGSSKSKKRAVSLDDFKFGASPEVYGGFLETYGKIESRCFKLVDKLVDENPFCDVTFSGYSFGAAMATLAAFRYATTRPMMRVGCLTLASPKVGFSHFRQVVHATPNLRVVRLELGNAAETKCQGPTVGGWHVGHTLVLNGRGGSSNNNNGSPTSGGGGNSPTGASSSEKKHHHPSVSVYKFETPKHKNAGAAFFKNSNPGLKKYISILEDLATVQNQSSASAGSAKPSLAPSSKTPIWPKDFANNAGKGVVVNNEKRLVV